LNMNAAFEAHTNRVSLELKNEIEGHNACPVGGLRRAPEAGSVAIRARHIEVEFPP
jgi:hypothetical protein